MYPSSEPLTRHAAELVQNIEEMPRILCRPHGFVGLGLRTSTLLRNRKALPSVLPDHSEMNPFACPTAKYSCVPRLTDSPLFATPRDGSNDKVAMTCRSVQFPLGLDHTMIEDSSFEEAN